MASPTSAAMASLPVSKEHANTVSTSRAKGTMKASTTASEPERCDTATVTLSPTA